MKSNIDVESNIELAYPDKARKKYDRYIQELEKDRNLIFWVGIITLIIMFVFNVFVMIEHI